MHLVYKFSKKVPKGKVTTYGILAKKVGTSPRAIGKLMNVNPYKDVPCHRVIMSDGRVGGYRKGTKKKIMLLRKENIDIIGNKVDNLKNTLFRF